MSVAVASEVSFEVEGETIRGRLFRTRPSSVSAAGVLLAEGFAGSKELVTDRYAAAFAAAGYVALTFDYRGFGRSDGRPRQEVVPDRQLADCDAGLRFLATCEGVDPRRLGVWGTSFGGGHAIVLAATRRQVRCAVAQVPAIDGLAMFERHTPGPLRAALARDFAQERADRARGAVPRTIPLVSSRRGAPCVMPGPEALRFFEDAARLAPDFRNEVTLGSIEFAASYRPVEFLDGAAAPLLFVVAEVDPWCPADLVALASARAGPSARVLAMAGGHFDVYGRLFDVTAAAARDWFDRHLAGGTTSGA